MVCTLNMDGDMLIFNFVRYFVSFQNFVDKLSQYRPSIGPSKF